MYLSLQVLTVGTCTCVSCAYACVYICTQYLCVCLQMCVLTCESHLYVHKLPCVMCMHMRVLTGVYLHLRVHALCAHVMRLHVCAHVNHVPV